MNTRSKRAYGAVLSVLLFAAGACTDSPLAPQTQAPRIVLDKETVLSESHQEVITFTARVLDASGEEVDSVPLEWETDNPGVLEVLGNGSFRTLANGTAAIVVRVPRAHPSVAPRGYFANIPDTEALVQVKQTASRIGLFSDAGPVGDDDGGGSAKAIEIWAIDQLVEVAARPTDSEGQIVEGLDLSVLSWTSEDENVFTVDEHGNVTPKGDGEAALAVVGEGLGGEVIVRVRTTQSVRACARLWTGDVEDADSARSAEACSSLLLTFTRGG